MDIAIDFDGTLVTHEYPKIGLELPGCVSILNELLNNGHKIILNTMRSGEPLKEAVKWFNDRNIPLHGINKNPTQHTWTTSQKCFGNIYLDDAALGAPLRFDPEVSNRPFMDWKIVEFMLAHQHII